MIFTNDEKQNKHLNEMLDIISKQSDLTKDKGARLFTLLSSSNDSAFDEFIDILSSKTAHLQMSSALIEQMKEVFSMAKENPTLKEYLENEGMNRGKVNAELSHASKVLNDRDSEQTNGCNLQ